MRSEISSKRSNFERQPDSALAPQHIDQQRARRSHRILEQERGAPRSCYPVGDFRDFEHRIHRSLDALEFAALFQAGNKLPQVLVSQTILPAIVGASIPRLNLESRRKTPHRLAWNPSWPAAGCGIVTLAVGDRPGAPADFHEAGSAPGVNWVVTGPTPLVFV